MKIGAKVLKDYLKKQKDADGHEAIMHAERLYSYNNCGFNYQYNSLELLIIADIMRSCKWDKFPDQLNKRQVKEALLHGYVPDWKDDEVTPIYMPKPAKKKTVKKY